MGYSGAIQKGTSLPFRDKNCPSSEALLPHKKHRPSVVKSADFSKKAGVLEDYVNSLSFSTLPTGSKYFRTLWVPTVYGPSDTCLQ